ncbi:acyltransferase family protein [Maribacter sp. X9]|uniref:acyltransferase family protein n=1 Tax=Maribacter sp. X9 TaxID=3402159 RepID=UPI003AF350B8
MPIKRRIYQIDLLRFIAAIGIMLAHYLFRGFKADNLTNLSFLELGGEWIKYCFVFIDLFFIISGFVITLSVRNKSLSYFFKSRVMRIFSVYWLCVFITYVVTILFGAPRFTVTFGQFLFNLTLLQDFFDIKRLDGAYWTMSVELRFYALAMAYLFIYKFRKIRLETISYTWLALSTLFVFAQNNIIAKVLDLFLMFEWSPAFIAGIVMAKIYTSKKLRLSQGVTILLCFVLSAYHRYIYLLESMEYYHVDLSETIAFFAILSIYLIMLAVTMGKLSWLNKPYFWHLGIMTYPLYLLHQRIGYIIFNNLMGHVNKYLILSGTIILMISLSFIIVKWVSAPLSNFLDKVLMKFIHHIEGIKWLSNPIIIKKLRKQP